MVQAILTRAVRGLWRGRSSCLAAISLAAGIASAPVAHAAQPVRQNLTQMIAAADIIVSGTVTRVSDGIDGGVAYTEVTLRIKGSARRELEPDSQYTFRQWGLQAPRRMPDGRFLLAMQIEGMPRWRAGEHVTVFLNPEATSTGLRSPVGLYQGKFTTVDGRIANGVDNRGLFDGVEVDAELSPEESSLLRQEAGAVDEATLLNLVSRAVDGRWVETGVMR